MKKKLSIDLPPCFAYQGFDCSGFLVAKGDVGKHVFFQDVIKNTGIVVMDEDEAETLITPERQYVLTEKLVEDGMSDLDDIAARLRERAKKQKDERDIIRATAKPKLYRIRITIEHEELTDYETRSVIADALIAAEKRLDKKENKG